MKSAQNPQKNTPAGANVSEVNQPFSAFRDRDAPDFFVFHGRHLPAGNRFVFIILPYPDRFVKGSGREKTGLRILSRFVRVTGRIQDLRPTAPHEIPDRLSRVVFHTDTARGTHFIRNFPCGHGFDMIQWYDEGDRSVLVGQNDGCQ